MSSNHLILCQPLLLPPSIFPSIRVISNESVLPIRWPKYWSFSFSISPSNEYSGLISFRMDWLDLLAVQGILKSLLQNHSSKASILWRSAFFIDRLSGPPRRLACKGRCARKQSLPLGEPPKSSRQRPFVQHGGCYGIPSPEEHFRFCHRPAGPPGPREHQVTCQARAPPPTHSTSAQVFQAPVTAPPLPLSTQTPTPRKEAKK